jgi:hypothetical protein
MEGYASSYNSLLAHMEGVTGNYNCLLTHLEFETVI